MIFLDPVYWAAVAVVTAFVVASEAVRWKLSGPPPAPPPIFGPDDQPLAELRQGLAEDVDHIRGLSSSDWLRGAIGLPFLGGIMVSNLLAVAIWQLNHADESEPTLSTTIGERPAISESWGVVDEIQRAGAMMILWQAAWVAIEELPLWLRLVLGVNLGVLVLDAGLSINRLLSGSSNADVSELH